MVRQVLSHKFEIDLWIGSLSIDIEDIAERCSLRLERWEEDGLGWTSGFVVETESGRSFLLLARDALRNQGPQSEVIAEGRDIIALGVDALLDELVLSLSLSSRHVLGRNHEAVETARQLADWLAANRPGAPGPSTGR
jgi:hypothetical protein